MTTINNAITAELELRRRKRQNEQLLAPHDWQGWCTTLFPKYFNREFAPHHVEFWAWLESIRVGVKPETFIAIWDRGGAKSTSAETACVRIGSKGVRRYGLYVCSTQDKADGHVQTIGSMLESKPYANYYGKMSRRAVNKYGSSKGWRHNRLITGTGFAVDAFGLDSGLRGAKIEDARPDFIIIDDVDERFDSPATTMKKIGVITETILPAGSEDCAILFIQNIIAADSIAARLVDGRADFMRNSIISGPHPAVIGLEYHFDEKAGKYIVTAGTPTWSGRTLESIESKINDWGLSAFLREAQHEVDKRDGPWSAIEFLHVEEENLPPFEDVAVWIDPAITASENSNCQGMSVGGRAGNRLIGLYWWEGVDTPLNIVVKGIEKGLEWGASHIGIETDQGGDTWKSVYYEACEIIKAKLEKQWLEEWQLEHTEHEQPPSVPDFPLPSLTTDTVSKARGKAHMSSGSKMERNSRMMTDYEKGKVVHLFGAHTVIEKALYRVPNSPWDLVDSHWWMWFDLIGNRREKFGAR